MRQRSPKEHLMTLYLYINREKIGLLKFLLEGYDGLAVLSTIDAQQGLVKVLVPRSRYGELMPLLSAISPDLIAPNHEITH